MNLPRALAAAAALATLTACAAGAPVAERASSSGPTGRVVVLAAASLTDVFEQVAADLERDNPGLDVVLSFGGSPALAQQVLSGAPADVLATASEATFAPVVEAGAAPAPTVFARNRLQLAVPAGNPGEVTGLADLARRDLVVALCAPAVPCGVAAQQVLSAAGVAAAPDTLEPDVRAVLAKVELGEVDAGLVYRTDVLAAGDEVEGVALPPGQADAGVARYPLAALREAANPDGAAAFVAAVLAQEGQRALADAGFDVS